MADLTFKVERLDEYPNAALVAISGAIDAKTVITFQEKLNKLQEEGILKFVLDMGGIKYVNSTGLGTLVNVADTLENSGGGIALVKIHPKVKVVFDMLGLNAFFKIFPNINEAMSFFNQNEAGGVNGGNSVATTPPVPPEVASSPETKESKEASPPPKEKEEEASAIKIVKCKPGANGGYAVTCVQTRCGVTLTLKKPGSYKCPKCAAFFKLTANGEAHFFDRKTSEPIQMKLSCTEECYTGLSYFIAVLAKRIGFSSEIIREMQSAITEVCSQVVEQAYQKAIYESYNVLISPSSTQLEIKIADYGNPIPQNDPRFFGRAKKVMDDFEHKQHPKGGNVVTMVKKL